VARQYLRELARALRYIYFTQSFTLIHYNIMVIYNTTSMYTICTHTLRELPIFNSLKMVGIESPEIKLYNCTKRNSTLKLITLVIKHSFKTLSDPNFRTLVDAPYIIYTTPEMCRIARTTLCLYTIIIDPPHVYGTELFL